MLRIHILWLPSSGEKEGPDHDEDFLCVEMLAKKVQ